MVDFVRFVFRPFDLVL